MSKLLPTVALWLGVALVAWVPGALSTIVSLVLLGYVTFTLVMLQLVTITMSRALKTVMDDRDAKKIELRKR